MPTTTIDYTGAQQAIRLAAQNKQAAGERDRKEAESEDAPCVVSTPFGLCIIEIQGELNLPDHAPHADDDVDPEYKQNFAKVDGVYDAVRFGKMSFDPSDPNKVVLYVGKSQRLLGEVETLREPLGVLRVSRDPQERDIKVVDIIEKKILFKQRPLPVM